MAEALVVLRLLLAAVFALAGAAKLADRRGSREALLSFGISERAATAAAWALPIAELVIAAALLMPDTARAGAVAAFVLLLGFCAGIARAIRARTDAECHCFGRVHSAPIGGATLIRNAALAAAAGFVAVAGDGNTGGSVLAWVDDLSATGALALGTALAVAALAWACFQLLRQHGRLLLRIDALEEALAERRQHPEVGLRPGTAAPEFTLPDVTGKTLSLTDLITLERPLLLVFSDPSCGPCSALLPQLAAWQRAHRERVGIAVVSRGGVEPNRAAAEEHGLHPVLLQEDREVAAAYQAHGTPTAVLIAADRTVGSRVAAGAQEIGNLVSAAIDVQAMTAPPELEVVPRAPIGSEPQ